MESQTGQADIHTQEVGEGVGGAESGEIRDGVGPSLIDEVVAAFVGPLITQGSDTDSWEKVSTPDTSLEYVIHDNAPINPLVSGAHDTPDFGRHIDTNQVLFPPDPLHHNELPIEFVEQDRHPIDQTETEPESHVGGEIAAATIGAAAGLAAGLAVAGVTSTAAAAAGDVAGTTEGAIGEEVAHDVVEGVEDATSPDAGENELNETNQERNEPEREPEKDKETRKEEEKDTNKTDAPTLQPVGTGDVKTVRTPSGHIKCPNGCVSGWSTADYFIHGRPLPR